VCTEKTSVMVPEPRILLALILFLSSAGKWFLATIPCVYTRGPGYRLNGPGIESRWGARFSAPFHTGPGAHPACYTRVTRSLSE